MAKAAPPRSKLNNFIRQGALHQGLLGDSRGWRAVFFGVFGLRMMRKMFGKTEEIVATEKIEPGHLLQLVAIAPPTRKERKAAKQAARARRAAK